MDFSCLTLITAKNYHSIKKNFTNKISLNKILFFFQSSCKINKIELKCGQVFFLEN